MLAGHDGRRDWRREGGPFDITVMAVSVGVIVGSVFIVNAASMRYRVAGLPVVSAATISVPTPTQ